MDPGEFRLKKRLVLFLESELQNLQTHNKGAGNILTQIPQKFPDAGYSFRFDEAKRTGGYDHLPIFSQTVGMFIGSSQKPSLTTTKTSNTKKGAKRDACLSIIQTLFSELRKELGHTDPSPLYGQNKARSSAKPEFKQEIKSEFFPQPFSNKEPFGSDPNYLYEPDPFGSTHRNQTYESDTKIKSELDPDTIQPPIYKQPLQNTACLLSLCRSSKLSGIQKDGL